MGKCDDCKRSKSSLFVHIVVCLFGIGSWIAINGLWVELPILVQHLPESWSLGSYLVIIAQVANIGPLLFTVAATLAPGKVPEKPVIYLLVTIGAVSCLLLAFLWQKTSIIAGQEHSTALLVLQFCLALVDCSSSVVFLPFMSVFKPQYMSTYFIGEGFSGLLPSIVALGQGAGAIRCLNQTSATNVTNSTIGEASGHILVPEHLMPNFPVKYFFIFLCAMMVVCGIAFTCLNHHPKCKREMVRATKPANRRDDSIGNDPAVQEVIYNSRSNQPNSNVSQFQENEGLSESANSSSRLLEQRDQDRAESTGNRQLEFTVSTVKISKPSYIYLLLLTIWINALSNGVLPSIQSYSCLPYGTESYHFAVTLASIANPAACFIAFFISTISGILITFLTLIGSGIAGYIILLASLSPHPYFVGETTGSALVISSWVLTTLCLTYAKVCIATVLRGEGRRGLLWCGAMTQIGSAAGSIVMFVLVSILNMFSSAPMCPV